MTPNEIELIKWIQESFDDDEDKLNDHYLNEWYQFLGSGGYSIVLLNRKIKKVLKIIKEQ